MVENEIEELDASASTAERSSGDVRVVALAIAHMFKRGRNQVGRLARVLHSHAGVRAVQNEPSMEGAGVTMV